jgi:hypothetical protein
MESEELPDVFPLQQYPLLLLLNLSSPQSCKLAHSVPAVGAAGVTSPAAPHLCTMILLYLLLLLLLMLLVHFLLLQPLTGLCGAHWSGHIALTKNMVHISKGQPI